MDVMTLQGFDFAMFSGTNMTFSDNVLVTFSFAKQTSIRYRIESDFQYISDPVEYLSIMIDLSDCQAVFSDPILMKKIRNCRVRLLANAIGPFGISAITKISLDKADLLRWSLERSYENIVEELIENLEKSSKEVQEKVRRLYLI